jgi:hypothetical protein
MITSPLFLTSTMNHQWIAAAWFWLFRLVLAARPGDHKPRLRALTHTLDLLLGSERTCQPATELHPCMQTATHDQSS